MGLDMYLQGSVFMGWAEQEKTAKKIQKLIDTEYKVDYVKVDIGYWRKANQIHGWFVENCQEGNDDCGTYYVSEKQLRELLKEVEEALLTENTENLEPKSGFFFGGTEIDEYYWDQLRATKKIIERFLNSKDKDKMDVYYTSSW
jgi:hypothetical protein